MFLKLGDAYTAALLVTDINGNRITNDTPVAVIKDKQTGQFWNGIVWQANSFNLLMAHVSNGVYSYNFAPDHVGVFEVTCKSLSYANANKVEDVEVYDDNMVRYDWLVNTPFTVSYTGESDFETVTLSICKQLDNTFWNGVEWVATPATVSMSLLMSGIYNYTFAPNEPSQYSITIYTASDSVFYILNATNTAVNTPPILVNHNSLIALDGSNTLLVDEKGLPVGSVEITAYDSLTKSLVGKTIGNADGTWNIMLKPGVYYFTFEKQGYVSVGFERSVK